MLAALAALAAGCGGDDGSPAPAPTAAPTSTATAAPTSTSTAAPTPTATRMLGGMPCPDYVPTSCTELAPGGQLPAEIKSCYVIKQPGTQPYVFDRINITNGGALYFVEAANETIDFRINSLLVEYGGVLQAGSPACPIGTQGGTVAIGLYGDDPSHQGTIEPAPPGITCLTNPGSDQPCFPAGRNPTQGSFYCTVSDSSDPCSSTTPPASEAANDLLEKYEDLNFDGSSFGYKVLAASYGGTIRLFGYKGTALVTEANDSNEHCVVPTAEESTLDTSEMNAWAGLTGSSWTRLTGQAVNPANAQQSLLDLDRVVPDWGVGDQIVVGTTDWYPGHSELRTIRAVHTVTDGSGMHTQLTVDVLRYPHATSIFDAKQLATDNQAEYTNSLNRTAADLRAAVGLLTRSIRIYSLGLTANDPFPDVSQCLSPDGTAPDSDCFFGGHTMFRQGFRESQMQGVEFHQLGQGGRMGHYPVHWHLAKSTAYTGGKAFLKDSSMWDSMTRFATVHGTHEVTLARNVGYLSVGHGYYIEDGSEIENLLCHNLGVGTRAALKEYYEAQADPKIWTGSPAAPAAEARYVPPILDGSGLNPTLVQTPNLLTGSDSFMPVTYWAMNAYNEFVGNYAAGVHGFGSCFWLLGSGVSGPSLDLSFAGFAKYNQAGAYQAPLLRFRGNSCTTATYALPAQAELDPAAFQPVGYTGVPNPYIQNADGTYKDPSTFLGKYDRPAVIGNFQPIQPNAANVTGCVSTGAVDADLAPNTEACLMTVVDRFTTSYNWAQVNFGSIWFRPWYYLFLNGAVTDQLFGGLTFVTAGSWLQVPPAYLSLAKNSLFVGTSQFDPSPYARRSGPVFSIASGDDLANYAPCAGARETCNLNDQGTGYFRGGGYQPKRLITIYDGPHYADGNLFLNVGSWQCDPQPCAGKTDCETDLPCGIYSSTTQPASPDLDPHKMIVIDAAVGWKQPNGFFYPPAFTYRDSTFYKKLPVGVPEPDPDNPLNQCFSSGEANDYGDPTELPGGCRHNVIDRTRNYIFGNMIALNGTSTITGPANPQVPLQITPIDSSTILIDVDGSLTGATGKLSGDTTPTTTSSVSRNPFFDAPAQSPECLSYGVQTSPYSFVTTIVAPVHETPVVGQPPTFIDVSSWGGQTPPMTPIVAIYRQWQLSSDTQACGQVCDGSNYTCERGTFMLGSSVGQAPYLTMTQPPSLSSTLQNGALYYIDTSTATQQPTDCISAITSLSFAAPFTANDTYSIYNLYARNDSVVSYQLYVGDGVQDLATIKGTWVRITPHLRSGGSDYQSNVGEACDPEAGTGWCANLPKPEVKDGILTVTLDQRPIADDYLVSAQADYARCMPRDMCYYDGTSCQPCYKDPTKCIRQGDFLPDDIAALTVADGNGKSALDVLCTDWAAFSSGTPTGALGQLSLVDCPANGCLSFTFTLPSNFVGDKTYAEVGQPLVQCFASSAWADDALVQRQGTTGAADPLCGAPRQQMAADFCSMP